MTKETAEKIQEIRIAMVELKNKSKANGCNIDAEMEDALQKMLTAEKEYYSTAGTNWSLLKKI